MSAQENVWSGRFDQINQLQIIKEKTARRARPLKNLDHDEIRVACDRISSELREIFVPTERTCEILLELVHCALSHARAYYPDKHSFLRRVYENSNNIPPYLPFILTGLAGTGKSQISKALMRLFPADSVVEVDSGHSPFPLVAGHRIEVQSRKSLPDILRPLSSSSGTGRPIKLGSADLIEDCARWQYRCGTSILVVDELQFLTQSDKATTLIAQVILGLTYVRVPTAIILNFSLLHRLFKRYQEERQRLLGHTVVLVPDGPDTEDWKSVLREYQLAVPDVFKFEFSIRSNDLWCYCAGLKRELVKLLALSYKTARLRQSNTVEWNDVVAAYCSSKFFSEREDIELLIAGSEIGPKKRSDLWCRKDGTPVVRTFTDNVFAAFPLRESNKYSVQDQVHYFLSEVAAQLQQIFFFSELPVRGGITIGELYIDSRIIIGPAVVKAVNLEKKASSPRVLLDESVTSKIAKVPLAKESLVYTASDGKDSLNYLGLNHRIFKEHKQIIERRLAEHEGNETIQEKYRWLLEYHQDISVFVSEHLA